MSLYTRTLSVPFNKAEINRFVALTVDDFEIPVSYARSLGDLCGVCSDLALISTSFIRQAHGVLNRFLVQK
jgi:hypothetical protein